MSLPCCVTWNPSGLCCSYPDESLDKPGPAPPCLSPLRLHKAGNSGSCQVHRPRPEGRGASVLWAWDLPTSDSAFLLQFRLVRNRSWHCPAAQVQAHTQASTREPLVHTACPEPWFQTTTRGPKEGGRRESLNVVGSREQEVRMEM